MLILFLASLALLSVATFFDVTKSNEGIKAGVAVEGNPIVNYFFGNKPTLKQLWLENGITGAIVAAVALTGLLFNTGVFAMGIGGMLAYAAHHVKGGLEWRKLLNAR